MSSPYPLHYTLRWPYYYYFPSTKKHISLPKMPIKVLPDATRNDYLKMVFCGDIMVLQNDVIPTLHDDVAHFLSDADIFIGNCEGPIGNHQPDPTARYRMKFHLSRCYLENMIHQMRLQPKQCYFSIANNHVGDWGIERVLETKKIAAEMGIHLVGLRENNQPPVDVFTVNTMKLGMFAWTDWVNCELEKEHRATFARRKDIAPLDWEAIKKEQGIDCLIALPHWEYEFQQYPHKTSQNFARHLFQSQAVDILVGAHTHMLQPLEKFGDGLCFYNLGNFCGLGAAWPVRMAPLLKVWVDPITGNIAGYELKVFVQLNQNNHQKIDILPLSETPVKVRDQIQSRIQLLFEMS